MPEPGLPATLVTTLTGAIDYAGLFPPAALALPDAVANYADYRASDDAWALGRLIVPAARLLALEAALARLDPARLGGIPWDLSVTLGPDWEADGRSLDGFHASGGTTRAVPDAIEARVRDAAAVGRLAGLVGSDKAVFGEVAPGPASAEVLAALAEAGLAAKIRMGGVTPDAFPAPEFVADFLIGVARLALPFKATAGLHHPIRGPYPLTYAPDAARGTMYGYLNVVLAAALAREGAPAPTVRSALLETDRGALRFDDDGLTWRESRVSRRVLDQLRAGGLRGWGSCSFREPMDELRPVLR